MPHENSLFSCDDMTHLSPYQICHSNEHPLTVKAMLNNHALTLFSEVYFEPCPISMVDFFCEHS